MFHVCVRVSVCVCVSRSQVCDPRLWVHCRWLACLDGGLWWLLQRSEAEYRPAFADNTLLITPFEDQQVIKVRHTCSTVLCAHTDAYTMCKLIHSHACSTVPMHGLLGLDERLLCSVMAHACTPCYCACRICISLDVSNLRTCLRFHRLCTCEYLARAWKCPYLTGKADTLTHTHTNTRRVFFSLHVLRISHHSGRVTACDSVCVCVCAHALTIAGVRSSQSD